MRGLAAIVFVVLVALPPGASAGVEGPEPAQEAILRVGAIDEIKTRNLLAAMRFGDPHTMAVLARVYDTAVQRNATTGDVVGRLAVGIDQDGDGQLDAGERGDFTVPGSTVTVFYDFGNAWFHDGVPVDAMDVLFSYHVLALNPVASSPLRALMDLGGGSGSNFTVDRWLWVLPADDGDGSTNTSALRFTLQHLYDPFPWAVLGIPVLPRHLFEDSGGARHADFGKGIYPEGDPREGQGIPTWETAYKPFDYGAAEAWSMTDSDVVGSGHFKFAWWSFGIGARLEANPDYAFGAPAIDVIVFRIYRTAQLLIFALRSGEIDIILMPITAEFIPDLESDPAIGLLEGPDLYPEVLLFNMRRQPFGYDAYPPVDRNDDIGLPFRRAIVHAADVWTMWDALLQRRGRIPSSMVSPDNDGWMNGSVVRYQFDPVMSNAILDNEGWNDTDGDGWREFPRLGDAQFEILTPQADYSPVLASAGAMIASTARGVVDINIISRPMAYGAILATVMARDFDLAIVPLDVHAIDPWTLGRGDPDYLFELFHSAHGAAGRNAPGFWDSAFDATAQASREAPDLPARLREVMFEQGILAEQLPAIPLLYPNSTWAYRADRFVGWQLVGSTPFNYWSLQGIEPVPPPPNPGPVITLNSPPNGTIMPPGVPIDLDVSDTDLARVDVTRLGFPTVGLGPPYDINTSAWEDGLQTILVRAWDSAGNFTDATFEFTIDGTPPLLVLESPADNSLVRGGTAINFSVSDANLFRVDFGVDGESLHPFPAPYDIQTDRLEDGRHWFAVRAADRAGNVVMDQYSFVFDSTRPTVSEREPEGPVQTVPSDLRVTFSEPVNTTSVEAAFSMTDGVNTWTSEDGTFYWSSNRTSFTFVPNGPLAEGREYHLTLAGTVRDDAGNEMGEAATWSFTTPIPEGPSRDVWMYATGIIGGIAALLALLLAYVIVRRKRREDATAKRKP